jgi:hypothetical protein
MTLVTRRILSAASVFSVLAVCLAGCSSTPAVEPVTIAAQSLQGQTVELPLDSTLNITTGKASVTSYLGTIAKPSIAKFIRGSKTSSAEFDPSIKPLHLGITMVTLTTTNGSGQYVTFTLDVVRHATSSPTP